MELYNVVHNANRCVLVVDDDRDIVSAIETILSMVGYDVIRAYNGTDCLKMVQEANPCLILLDLMLPDMSGKQVAEELKKMNGHSKIPIVLISAAREAKQAATEIHAKACIEKPFELEDLVSTVEKCVIN